MNNTLIDSIVRPVSVYKMTRFNFQVFVRTCTVRCPIALYQLSSFAASLSSDDVFGICTCLGKKSTVALMQTPPVSRI